MHFKQIVESGLYKCDSFLSKVNHPLQHFNCALAENTWNQVNRIYKLYLPLCSKGAKTTTEEPEPAAERESEEQWKEWSQSAASKMIISELHFMCQRRQES